ncbi:agmatine deiminase family protein [Confluentibacter flavum]|uniref:Agmatine deiminase family protein n=1 Tax=Confluentibacter flavum TaxID=1909700 RepID=A0A2N3HJ20_9FLAO|nr:agmatine deiminase family protein [Confluentibacter flavum]PKQ44828.1 agmatine deiminase family protein [Confluentibacter flavum]
MPTATFFFGQKSLSRHSFTLFLIALILFTNNSISQNKGNDFRFPAEFEQHQAVWLSWEEEDATVQATIGNIIKGLSGRVPIKIATPTAQIQKSAKVTLNKMGIDVSIIQFLILPGARLWLRDNGAQFLVNDDKDIAAVDFNWSNYGYYDWLLSTRPQLALYFLAMKMNSKENLFSNADKEMAGLMRARRIKSELVMEGGSLEINGKGILLQSEQVTLQRNPDWTKEDIEQEYLRIMNIKKVIWLKNGTVDDTRSFIPNNDYVSLGTGGHTDEFVRFADANTILLAWVDEEDINKHPLNRINYERMLENYNILKDATDKDGKPFRIIKVPLPTVIEWTAEIVEKAGNMEYDKLEANRLAPDDVRTIGEKVTRVASVSYLNFLVSNGVIINAYYTNHGTSATYEAKVKAIFKDVFPNLEQVWIDALPLNRLGGGIHCITLQEPLHKMPEKFVLH